MAAMIIRAVNFTGQSIGSSAASLTPFKNQSEFSAWAAPYIQEALAAGLMNGTGNGNFAPNIYELRLMQ